MDVATKVASDCCARNPLERSSCEIYARDRRKCGDFFANFFADFRPSINSKDKWVCKGCLQTSVIKVSWNFQRTGAPERIKNHQKITRKVDFSEPRLLQC